MSQEEIAGGSSKRLLWVSLNEIPAAAKLSASLTRFIFLAGFSLSLVSIDCSASDQPSERHWIEVEPILKSKCYPCHSHAARTTEGGLTLDSRNGWEKGGDSGPAIEPGKPERSLLVRAIRGADPETKMPPDETLSSKEIKIIEQWIQTGAFDPRTTPVAETMDADWWSLQDLRRPEVPNEGHPIDAFITQKHREKGLEPTGTADPTTLVRRAYMDLHGLHPTRQQVSEFLNTGTTDTFIDLIDQLLASPRYGERWARHWLDVIHFADSHGCEHDVKRDNAWRYRDYVIQRFNEDVCWDRFILEQLAADVIYPDEPHLNAALGFIAAGPLELSRAGTAPVAFDYLDRDDMVTQTTGAFLSTTASCARCHAHKFDPITQEDYYALQAVFAGIGKGDIEYDASSAVQKTRRDLERILSASNSKDRDILLLKQYQDIVKTWVIQQKESEVHWSPLQPNLFLSLGGATLTMQDDGTLFASGEVPDEERYTISAPVHLDRVTAIRLDVLRDERLPMSGPGRAGNGNLHLTEIDAHWIEDGSKSPVKLTIARASADFDQDGWTASQAIDGDTKSGWAIFPKVNESHHIVFELTAPLVTTKGGKLAITLKQLHPPKHVIGRFKLSVTDASGDMTTALPKVIKNGIAKPMESRTDEEQIAIAAAALKAHATHELETLPPKHAVYGVSASWSHAKKLESPQSPKPVHLLKRGAFNQPQELVAPGALSALSSLDVHFNKVDANDEASRRIALANWIADPTNPLTWRSIVNRVWHFHFGRGLVETTNDFGRMGKQPSHPELLDWLACWFRDDARGSLKELHRLILTSKTWQRSSGRDSYLQSHQLDADDVYLWKAHRRRLDADSFRDSLLSISETLDLKMGGPGVEHFIKSKGPQATPSLDYFSYDWNSPGANRRSIYRVVWRGIPDPFMEALDFPDLGMLAPERGESVSALQSLALFNNDFVLHCSIKAASRFESQATDSESQIRLAVEAILLRSPASDELIHYADYVAEHGLAAFCRVLFNSNEFLYVD